MTIFQKCMNIFKNPSIWNCFKAFETNHPDLKQYSNGNTLSQVGRSSKSGTPRIAVSFQVFCIKKKPVFQKFKIIFKKTFKMGLGDCFWNRPFNFETSTVMGTHFSSSVNNSACELFMAENGHKYLTKMPIFQKIINIFINTSKKICSMFLKYTIQTWKIYINGNPLLQLGKISLSGTLRVEGRTGTVNY